MDRSVTIASPCYNEADSLPSYFERVDHVRAELAKAGWRADLLLIDDGSRDATPALLEEYAKGRPATRVLRHPQNLGYGAAIKTALALSEAEWVVFVDSDSNYDQRLVLQLAERAGPDVDLINVSILAPGGGAGYPWYRLFLSSVASRIYRVLLPRTTRGVYTMTSGFRMYRRSLAPKMFPRADDFVATSEIMLRALKAGARVAEFPATNSPREHGVSKMRFLRVSLGHLRLAARTLFGRLPPAADVDDHLRRIGMPRAA